VIPTDNDIYRTQLEYDFKFSLALPRSTPSLDTFFMNPC
jgi:hypothetical protein